MNYCAECTGTAIHVLLGKLGEELERSGVDEHWCLLAAASELVDDLVQCAQVIEDQCIAQQDEANMGSMPAVGSC